MKKITLVLMIINTLIIGNVSADSSVDPNIPKYSVASGVSGNLSSVGSDTLANLMTLWAEEFKRFYPNVNIQIQAAGSSTAPPALTEATSNLGPMSRKMKDKEIEAFEKRYGYKPTAVPVAIDALAVYVNKDNPIKSLSIPEVSDPFIRNLYATYISYLSTHSFAYTLTQQSDLRGELAELLKSPRIGQIFVSRTRAGFTRGNHYHDTKVEKFIVMEGDAVIRFRHILGGDVIEYPVSGREFRVVDIPPGYTHSIENVGKTDMIVLFWANEIFNPSDPDTFGLPV